jgi:hypothetical protein
MSNDFGDERGRAVAFLLPHYCLAPTAKRRGPVGGDLGFENPGNSGFVFDSPRLGESGAPD